MVLLILSVVLLRLLSRSLAGCQQSDATSGFSEKVTMLTIAQKTHFWSYYWTCLPDWLKTGSVWEVFFFLGSSWGLEKKKEIRCAANMVTISGYIKKKSKNLSGDIFSPFDSYVRVVLFTQITARPTSEPIQWLTKSSPLLSTFLLFVKKSWKH